jgi:hypothetical protein
MGVRAASAAKAGRLFGGFAVRLEVVPFPVWQSWEAMLCQSCAIDMATVRHDMPSFPEEERFENKRTGKGATSSRTALGCVGLRL